MAREVVEREIGGHVYKVTLLGAKAGRTMIVRLLKLLGPTLAGFVENTVTGKGDGIESIALGIAEAFRQLAEKIHADDIGAISDELAKFTSVVIDHERQPQLDRVFDDHFAGKYDCMLQWLAFALEANFSSFFGGSAGAKTLLGRVMTAIASMSTSRPASTGTSTESQPANTTTPAT